MFALAKSYIWVCECERIKALNIMSDTNKFPPMNRTELARKYKVSLPTFNKWLRLISNLVLIENQRIFTPKQVELIINHLGEPPD